LKIKILILSCLFLMVFNANAEVCTKHFSNHLIAADGSFGLYQGVGGAWWEPCSVSTAKNGVTPEACKSALATYLSAKTQGKPITLSYPGTCAQLNSTSSTPIGFSWFGVYW